MIALLGLLSPFLGILGSLLPNIVNIFAKREEYKHDIEILKVQGELSLQAAQANLDVENVKADAVEGAALYDHDKSIDGGKFINALRASIRPVITYLFFFLFCAVKISAATVMIHSGLSIPDMLTAVWDTETMALFSTILAFWFGSRVLEKMSSDNRNRPILNRTINITSKK